MVIYLIDDEPLQLQLLNSAVLEAEPDAKVYNFFRANQCLNALKAGTAPPDVAFLDIEMPGMGGMELARCIKETCPKTWIIFVTGYSEYALDAMRMHAKGYIVKPVTAGQIRAELDEPPLPSHAAARRCLRVQTFGNFEVFAGDRPVRFERSRTKEVLAYLVDRRGAAVNTAEICAALWEDDRDTAAMHKQFRKHMSDLTRTLKEAGAEEALSKGHNSFAVVPEKLECDYYDYLDDKLAAINAYRGEYMSQYSWAEMTHGTLE